MDVLRITTNANPLPTLMKMVVFAKFVCLIMQTAPILPIFSYPSKDLVRTPNDNLKTIWPKFNLRKVKLPQFSHQIPVITPYSNLVIIPNTIKRKAPVSQGLTHQTENLTTACGFEMLMIRISGILDLIGLSYPKWLGINSSLTPSLPSAYNIVTKKSFVN